MEKMKHLAIENFRKKQTLENLQEVKNLGMNIKKLEENKWQLVTLFKLPIGEFIPLYTKNLKLEGIGVYGNESNCEVLRQSKNVIK